MFDDLSSKLTDALKRLAGKGVLSEDAVKEGLREIRRVLLEADVSFELTRQFLERVQEKAIGVSQLKGVKPGQQLVKIVFDELVTMLGEKQAPIAFASIPPTVILMVGLQGSGKTTTAGKLAKRLKLEQKAPFLVAADVYRPAAVEQLATLARQVDVGFHGEPGRTDVAGIVKRGIEAAAKARARSVIVDTAGRLQIDDEMMNELKDLKAAIQPHEILLVADGMTGQDAVRIAKGFHDDEALQLPRVGDAFRLDLEALAVVKPDLILGWPSGNSPAALARLRRLGYRVIAMEPQRLADVADQIEAIGRLAGTEPAARTAAAAFRNGLAALQAKYEHSRPGRIFYQIAPEPLITVSRQHFIGQSMALCGGDNVFADLPGLTAVVSFEAVVARAPDVIVASDFTRGPGSPIDGSPLDRWRSWTTVPAVARNRLFVIDPDLMSVPGPRLLAGITQLCAALNGVG